MAYWSPSFTFVPSTRARSAEVNTNFSGAANAISDGTKEALVYGLETADYLVGGATIGAAKTLAANRRMWLADAFLATGVTLTVAGVACVHGDLNFAANSTLEFSGSGSVRFF